MWALIGDRLTNSIERLRLAVTDSLTDSWSYDTGVWSSNAPTTETRPRRDQGPQRPDEYARQHLFGPLGIDDFHWKKTPTGLHDTEGGLYLNAEDLARIGLLYLRDGIWRRARILPAGWVDASFNARPFGDDPEAWVGPATGIKGGAQTALDFRFGAPMASAAT
jgi:hypothetical protein